MNVLSNALDDSLLGVVGKFAIFHRFVSSFNIVYQRICASSKVASDCDPFILGAEKPDTLFIETFFTP